MLWAGDVILACVAAPFVGSFLGLLAERLPVGEPVVLSRSRCPTCHHPLSAVDLIPLINWLWRRRCAYCDAPISFFYPLIELAALVIVLWAAVAVPYDIFWVTLGMGWALVALSAMDIRHGILADVLTLPLLLSGLGLALLNDRLDFSAAVIGSLVGGVGFAAIAWAYRRWRGRDGLGLGDVKLMSAGGSWVGWMGLPSVLVLASGLALAALWLAARRVGDGLDGRREVCFGPFLAVGIWLVWLYGPIEIAGY